MSGLSIPIKVLEFFIFLRLRKIDLLLNWVHSPNDVRDPGNMGTIIRFMRLVWNLQSLICFAQFPLIVITQASYNYHGISILAG